MKLNLDKFKRELLKGSEKLSVGFNDPMYWVSTGSYALNYLISGDFTKGIPLGKVTMLAGQSGSGKSFLASGNLVRNAQEAGYFVVLIDSENALDSDWLMALGVDIDETKLMKINAAMIDDVAAIISKFMKDFKDTYGSTPRADRPKVLFVIDSLGMLMTPTDVNQFEAGEMKGDMGRKPKALNALVRNCVNMFGEWDIGLVATNHSYASQDMFDPDDKITGGQGFIYASSIVLAMQKRKLKEDEDGNKTTDVKGIRSAIKIMKTRYNKPFETVELKIPYSTGLDPYSGLLDLFEQKNVLVKDGNKLKYVTLDGVEHKYFRKGITDDLLDLIMKEYPTIMEKREQENAAARKLSQEEASNDE